MARHEHVRTALSPVHIYLQFTALQYLFIKLGVILIHWVLLIFSKFLRPFCKALSTVQQAMT